MRTNETTPQRPDDRTQSFQIDGQLVIRGDDGEWLQGADPVEVER